MSGALLWTADEPLVLASRSAARIAILSAAGIPLEALAADIDERAAEESARHEGADAAGVALSLARAKASAVSGLRPARLVLGADQTLACDGAALHKPADRAEAEEQLRMLSGKRHALHSAAALVKDGHVLFETASTAWLTVRALSEGMIARYLDAAGDAPLASVGAYQLEGLGIHLFESIEGDHFTILGLPLMPLLAFFRQLGVVPQ